jgi:2-methylcitrate dehydratase PrpD
MQNTPLGQESPTRQLAAFAAGLQYRDIPTAVVEQIKMHMLDGIGVCLHGARLPWTRHVAEVAMAEQCAPVATLWGDGRRTSVSQAVLVNSTAGHAFEMDDIHKDSVVHPNSLAVPVVMALAESRAGSGIKVSGSEAIAALVAGYEVGTRVGNAATTALFLNGFHPQGTSGVFVAAAAAGRVLGFDADAMQHTMGIAGSMGAGLMAAQEGAMVKRLHCGRAAQAGVHAAALAQRGFTGISNVLEAAYGGFLSSFGRDYRIERLLDGLGTDWEAGKVGYKMYPNVTSIHAALDGMKELMQKHQLQADDIQRIDVGCGHMTYVHTAWPYIPEGVTSAQMNLFYGLSVMALRGSVSAADYELERIAEPAVLSFMKRIHPYEDDAIESRGPAFRHAAILRVHTGNGALLQHEEWSRRGSPECPIDPKEVEAKFFANSALAMPRASAQRIVEQVAQLDKLASLDVLLSILKETKQ